MSIDPIKRLCCDDWSQSAEISLQPNSWSASVKQFKAFFSPKPKKQNHFSAARSLGMYSRWMSCCFHSNPNLRHPPSDARRCHVICLYMQRCSITPIIYIIYSVLGSVLCDFILIVSYMSCQVKAKRTVHWDEWAKDSKDVDVIWSTYGSIAEAAGHPQPFSPNTTIVFSVFRCL